MLAWQIEQEMEARKLTQPAMARRMESSPGQLDRLPDLKKTSITLHTLEQAAAVLGKRLGLEQV